MIALCETLCAHPTINDKIGHCTSTCIPAKKLVLVSRILAVISAKFICETRASYRMIDRKTRFARVQAVFDLVDYIKSYSDVSRDQK